MTAPLRPSFAVSTLIRSQGQYGDSALKDLSKNAHEHQKASRRWFAALLWRAFPAPSESEVANKAAEALDVSHRQVRNWLRCENDASLSYVCAVMLIAGVELSIGPSDRSVERRAS